MGKVRSEILTHVLLPAKSDKINGYIKIKSTLAGAICNTEPSARLSSN